jgi:hypothetical protein
VRYHHQHNFLNMVYIHNGVLLSYKEEWNYVVWEKLDVMGHNVKWSKPGLEW